MEDSRFSTSGHLHHPTDFTDVQRYLCDRLQPDTTVLTSYSSGYLGVSVVGVAVGGGGAGAARGSRRQR